MAAKLQCEICGGKLVGKPGGIFECDSCGTEYSTAWAREKIQEIQGTVKVEGTVEVKGSVQVEGAANAQSLIRRGNLALEDGKWNDANQFFNDALNADPENAEAYLGLLMAELHVCHREDLVNQKQPFDDKKNFQKAIRFGDEKFMDELTSYITTINNRNAEKKRQLEEERNRLAPYRGLIAAGQNFSVGVKDDGTVVAEGDNDRGKCDVHNWKDIVAVAAGDYHTVGLKADGTVVAVGYNFYGMCDGRCDVHNWKDIVAVAAGEYHTVGLRADGTVVAVGDKDKGQCDVHNWKDIVAVAAGTYHTVGLKADGTVVGLGFRTYGVKDWKDIVAVAARGSHTVGLKADGTVVAVGDNYEGQCNVHNWKDIVAVAAGDGYTVGLKVDGTVVAVGRNSEGQCDVHNWKDIVAVAAGDSHTIGLKADGTVVAVGDNDKGQCDVSDWKLLRTEAEKAEDYCTACKLETSDSESDLKKAVDLFKDLKDYKDSAERTEICRKAYTDLKSAREERERAEEAARKERERVEAARKEKERAEKIAPILAEKTALQTELTNLKGIFSGKRRREIEAQLNELENRLKYYNQ